MKEKTSKKFTVITSHTTIQQKACKQVYTFKVCINPKLTGNQEELQINTGTSRVKFNDGLINTLYTLILTSMEKMNNFFYHYLFDCSFNIKKFILVTTNTV